MKVKEGGIYESFSRHSRIDGDFYFKHDYKIQKNYHDMDKDLKTAVSKGRLEEALDNYDRIVKEKRRNSAEILDDKKSYKAKVTGEETGLLKSAISKLTDNIKNENDPEKTYEDIMLLSRAFVTTGRYADSAALLLKLLSKGNSTIPVKGFKDNELDAATGKAADAVKDRSEIIKKIRQAILRDPASMNKIVLSMKTDEIKEIFGSTGAVFNGVSAEDISDVTSNMTLEQEGVFMQSLVNAGCGELKDALIIEFYGVSGKSYDELIALTKEFTKNERAIRDILDREAKKKTENIMIRIIGPDIAKLLLTGGKK